VIVPAYGGASTIEACLRSILRAVAGWDHEFLVVESSGDGTAEVVRRCYPEVTLITSPQRLAAGQARNREISLARGQWLFCVDQNCQVPSDWMTDLMRSLHEPGAAAAGGSIAAGNPENLSGWAVYFLVFLDHFLNTTPASRNSNFLIGCNNAWHADVWRHICVPDRTTLGEDVLLSQAVRQQGWDVIYDPAACVVDQNRRGWAEFRRYNREMGRAAVAYQLERRSCCLGVVQRLPVLIFAVPLVALPAIA